MLQSLAAVTVLVPSYDDGLAFFRDVLGFAVLEDTPLASRSAGWLSRRRLALAPCWCSRFRATSGKGRASATRPEDGSAFSFTPTTSGADYEICLGAASISWKRRAASPMGSLRSLSIPGAESGICCSQPAKPPTRHEVRSMSLERQVLFWGLALAALLLVVYVLGSIITPFAAGIVLGYLLDPVVLKLQRFGLQPSRRLASHPHCFRPGRSSSFSFLSSRCWGISSFAFAQHLPGYAMRLQAIAVEEGNAFMEKYGGHWLEALGLEQQLSSAQIQKSVGDFVAQGAQWLLDAFTSLVSGGAALFNFLSLLIVTPVVAFYILVDWHRMIAKLDSWLPLEHRETLRKIAREINHALAGFIRGQSIVCLFLGVWYSLGLTLIGLDYGFLIGVVAGVLSFVPYVGSLTALVLSLSVALFQGWPSLKLFLLALGVVGTGQFLEGNVLSPQLVGESIGLHPVWLMFALLAFGQLFGFVGLIIAVPTAAAIGVVARHLIALYLASPLYRGRAEPETP